MTVRLRDRADLLQVDTDWSQSPKLVIPDVPFYARPETAAGNGEGAFAPAWTGYLPPLFKTYDLARLLTSAWRVRWDGDDYAISAEVVRHRTARRVRYLSVQLSRAGGAGGDQLPPLLLPDVVTVEPKIGANAYTDVWGDPFKMPCQIKRKRILVRDASGDELTSGTQIWADAQYEIPNGSKITTPDGTATVIDVTIVQALGPGVLPHQEIALR